MGIYRHIPGSGFPCRVFRLGASVIPQAGMARLRGSAATVTTRSRATLRARHWQLELEEEDTAPAYPRKKDTSKQLSQHIFTAL